MLNSTLQISFQTSCSTGNIGIPLQTVSCFVIQPANNESDSAEFAVLPIGEVGELAVGGEQLADGYLNNEDKTRAAFIDSPYGRVYRTGDKARLTEDGTLECLGRIVDGQVKLRGQRIELGEIEHAILKTPGCHGVCARVSGTVLVAFCAADDHVTEEQVLRDCRHWLPQFMVPGEVVLMKELPRLPSGKVDAKSLLRQFEESKQHSHAEDSIGSNVDPELLHVLQGFFGSSLGTKTELARAGLDSLTAIGLSSSLRKVGYDMTAASLLQMKTIGNIVSAAVKVDSADFDHQQITPVSVIDKLADFESEELAFEKSLRTVQDVMPCTQLQVAMLSETLRNAEAYWNTVDLEIHTTASASQVGDAMRRLIQQHDILRTGFLQHDSTFYSVIFDDIDPNCINDTQYPSTTEARQNSLLQPLQIYIEKSPHPGICQVHLHLHHAIYDGWSMDMLRSDLARALDNERIPQRQQFREVVSFMASPKRQQYDEKAKVFWADYLFGWNKSPFPRLTSKVIQSDHVHTVNRSCSLPRDAVAQYVGSKQVPFQAALALVWGGILGLQDIVFGSVTSGRTIPVDGIENIIGPCMSSLPLRVNMEAMNTVDDLVNSISSGNRRMMEHITLSQLDIKKLAHIYGSEQLYDVLFVYQESPEQRQQARSTVKEVMHADRLETKLVLEVQPLDDGFALQATFHEKHFSAEIVQSMLHQIEHLSSEIFRNPRASLESIKQHQTDRSTYNLQLEKMDRPSGPDDLAAVVEQAAARYQERPAISFATQISSTVFEPTTITYGELNRNANRIAHFLMSQNVKPGTVIPIIMHKSIRLYTAILGITKAGCGYLPLLPSNPRARILEIFQQSASTMCLTDEASMAAVPSSNAVRTILIDEESMEDYPDTNPSVHVDSGSAAYVIYTSGTTGTPKGVTVSHKNIASNVTYLGIEYPDAKDRPSKFLQACSQAFDVSVFEIFFAWHKGMCLCAAPNDTLFADLEETIRKFEITHLSLTPTIASLIDPRNVPTVGFLVTAGEPMTSAVHSRWNDLLWQGYGPSETTNICSVKKMSTDDYIEHLGLVFDNTSVVVLQPKSLLTLPMGWAGEFCFGGDQVANGYLNMPRLTAEKFIEHPTYGRIYRSGDFGRMLPDGSLVILGRIDDQLKLRGQRIEGAEVNGIVSTVAAAAAAVTLVLKREDSASEWLVTFYVSGDTQDDFQVLQPDMAVQERVFAELHARLLPYMIPSYLIPVSHIPLTPSGKVDKRAINADFSQLSKEYLRSVIHSVARDDERDWTATEQSVASVTAQALNVSEDEVGRWSPLAILGLDSISAIKVSKQLADTFNTTVPISAILQNPTVAQLAKVLEADQSMTAVKSRQYFKDEFLQSVTTQLAKEGKDVVEILPCSPLQEAMVARGKTSYYNKTLLRLHVDAYEMRGHWQEMCNRHSILRTCFVSTEDAQYPVAQVSLESWTLPWHEFTVTQPSLQEAIQEHLGLVPEPLDTNTPPLSLALIKYGKSDFLSFICHHSLYDGVAMECLWREVEALARGQQLKPVAPYKPFLDEALSLPETNGQFWKHQFAGFKPSLLFPRFNDQAMEQVTHTMTVERSLRRTQDRIKSLGVSLLSVCQAAMSQVLSVVGKKTDICFGNVMNGRTISMKGIERLVAPCFNTIPVRQDLSGSISNIDLVKRLMALNAEMLEHQFTPLRQIQKIAVTEKRSLFDTLLLVQQPLQEMDVGIWTLEEDAGDMDLPLVCEVTPCPSVDSLVLNVHYDMSEVPSDLAMGMAELFKHTFQQIIQSPHAVMSEENITKSLLDQVHYEPLHFYEDDEEMESIGDDFLWTKEESDVRDIFAQLSKMSVRNIDHTTSLFKLGLDSINAVQVASLLRQKGYTVSASDVVECQNCLEISRRIFDNGYKPATEVEKYDFNAFEDAVRSQLGSSHPTSQILPCTPMQSAMLSAFTSSEGVNYLNEISLEMNAGITASMVMEKWAKLVETHAMLRTGFAPVRHTDCSYAMLQHRELSSRDSLDVFNEDFDKFSWKKASASAILKNIQTPPWRLAVATKNERVTIYLVIHHAVYDGTSLQQILANFARLLNNCIVQPVENVRNGLSTILQRSSGELADASAFWRDAGNKAIINQFPLLTPLREATRHVLTEEIASSLSVSELNKLVKRLGVSTQAVILATWTRLLACYTGEESVVFGVTLSGRTCEDTLETPIPCLTTVPVVGQNSASNRELLDQTAQWVSEMHQHQFLPLSRIQKELGHPASSVFDTLIAYQKIGHSTNDRPWVQKQDDATVEYPVSLEIEPSSDDVLYLRLIHFSDIVPTEQAKLLLQQFDASIQDLLRNPDGVQAELHTQHPEVFAISPPIEANMDAPVELLHQFVEMQAKTNPDKLALEHVSGFRNGSPIRKQWSFSQLDAIGNKIANLLSERTKAGSIIAIHFDKCPEAYFSILGILKSGSAFVALDFNAPNARKEFIMQDSHAPCLLTGREDVIDFEVPCEVIVIDDGLLSTYPDTPCVVNGALDPSNTCYCLYTSGTTGTPKGCEITHENTVQCMMAFQDLFRGHWAEDSRWLQFAALHFDVSVLEQYWSWSVGIAVVAAKKDLILDDLVGFINNVDITHIDLTPSLARLTHPDTVPSLCRGIFITGGEQLKQEILDAWGSKGVIYNAYGPTEATIGVTTFQRVPQNGRPSNIGKQFRNVGSYVFQKDTEIPVLRGAVGELCVSGKLVGKGYLNRPELTDEKFPTLRNFNERIYRTGDLVRILHDGCFEFLGRADDQVKLRGQRLELGEIDHVIRSLPNIHDVATLVAKHMSSGKDVLVSFIVETQTRDTELQVLEDDTGLGARARDGCRDKLPGYMVPSYFLKLPYIPLSPNNKAEAKQLKKLFAEMSQETLLRLASATVKRNLEDLGPGYHRLRSLVAEFCSVDEETLTETTSIFDMNVDSITVLQLSSFLAQNGFSAALPALILRNPIISDLAAAVSTGTVRDSSADVKQAKQIMQACEHKYKAQICRDLGISPSDVEGVYPCSPLQQGMLAKTAVEDGEGSYFNTFSLILQNDVSIPKLKQALNALVEMEAILRTSFVQTSGGFLQVVQKATSALWKDYLDLEEAIVSDKVQLIRQEWINSNKNDVRIPFKVSCIGTGHRYRVVLHIFHGLYDGTSFDLLMKKLWSLYKGFNVRAGPNFADALARGPLTNHGHARQEWAKYLENWVPTTTRLGTEDVVDKPISFSRIISAQKLESLRAKNNVTMQSVLLAAWTSVLQRLTGSHVTTGVIVSGRSIAMPRAEEVIGPLFNTLPFFSSVSNNLPWVSLLKRCQEFNAMVLDDPHVPLQQIQKSTSGGKAMFDNLFAYQIDGPKSNIKPPWSIEDSGLNPDYPLAFEVTRQTDDSLQLLLVANSGVTNSPELVALLDTFENAITSMESETHVPVEITQETDMTTSAQDGSITAPTQFSWTVNEAILRDETSIMANVSSSEILPSTTWIELGLDSIDAVQLSARLKKHQLLLSPSAIMNGRTIENISSSLTSLKENHQTSSSSVMVDLKEKLRASVVECGFDMTEVEDVLPTTPLQDSMVSGMIESGFSWYYNHEILEVAEDVDIAKLQSAWSRLLSASPVLRTGFVEVMNPNVSAVYAQVVYKSVPELRMVTLNSKDELQQIIVQSTKAAASAQGRHNLVQVVCAQLHSQTFFVLSIAHALYDGWSLALLHEDLRIAYEKEQLTPRPSPEIFLQRSLSSLTPEATDFWANYLDGVPPTIVTDVAVESPHTVRAESISAVTVDVINEFCRHQKISLQTLFHTCWATILARKARSLDVVFGTILSGRDFEDAENLMFPTMNTVAFRSIIHGTIASFLQYTEENVGDLRSYQMYPLRKAKAAANIPGTDLFNSLFLLQKTPTASDSQSLFKSVDGSSSVDYPLCVEAAVSENKLEWTIACQVNDKQSELGHDVLGELDNILQYILHHADEDVVVFTRDGAKICGSKPITLAVDDSLPRLQQEPAPEEWNDNALAIRNVLSQVSNVAEDDIQLSSSLYHLGLDSITAIKVSSLLKQNGIFLRPTELVRASSIAKMAELAATTTDAGLSSASQKPMYWNSANINTASILSSLNVSAEQTEHILPALPMQVYMMSAWQNTEGELFYPEFAYAFSGPQSTTDLAVAWEKTTELLPILRTCLASTGEQDIPFIQIVLKPGVEYNSQQPFVHLEIQDGDKNSEKILRLRIHHALYDGVSLPAIMDVFLSHVREGSLHEPPSIEEWSTIAASTTATESRKTFWEEYLSGYVSAPVECNPTPRTSLFTPGFISNTKSLGEIAAAHGISLQSLIFAAYARAIAPAGAESIVLGIYLANRDNERIAASLPTLNLVPLRVSLSADCSILDSAEKVHQDIRIISTNGNAQVGLWEIFQWTGVKVDRFVNFLTLPVEEEPSAADEISLTTLPTTTSEALMARKLDSSLIANNAVRDAYPVSSSRIQYFSSTLTPGQDSIDVEFAVRNNQLDIGIFGPSALITSEGANELLQQIGHRLTSI